MFDQTVVNSAFSWPGAKYKHIRQINLRLPSPRKIWVDVFGGSGVVTINRLHSRFEVLNDKDPEIYNVYNTIKTCGLQLADRLKYTINSREEFIWCRDNWKRFTGLERVAMWLYARQMSFSDTGQGWSRVIKPRATKRIDIDSILKMSVRLQNVELTNMDAIECIRVYDNREAIIYLDPDYIGAEKLYRYGVDHRKMLDTIQESRSFFAVSNFRNKLYDSYQWDAIHEWDSKIAMDSSARNIREALYIRTER